jgi:dTDP-4-dehydrorhamnose 3,5-epimerase
MSRFTFIGTPLQGLKVLERRVLKDTRGYLERLFDSEELAALVDEPLRQVNHTLTHTRGAVRGMHFQHPPHAELKVVSCLRGEVFDVAVDLRAGSPTFLKWFGERLSGDNARALCIPKGFAHGFQTLTEDCEMLYFHTAPYMPSAEDGVHPADGRISIEWPLPIAQLSEKDAQRRPLDQHFVGIRS